jgi:hypothetical protein
MKLRHLSPPYCTRGNTRGGFSAQFTALALVLAAGLLWSIAGAKTPLAGPTQEKEEKAPALRWDPPRIDAPLASLSKTPACSLPEVLNQAGKHAEELVDHLQNFIAHEQVRYDSRFVPESSNGFMGTGKIKPGENSGGESLTAKFDYVVDFGGKSGQFQVHEFRKPLPGANNEYLRAIVDKGLPALALIFRPAMQSDYEMRCEGSVHWHNEPAWVVDFHQKKGKRPRTVQMGTGTKAYPLRIKGRAWIAANSGQVIHLETNLVSPVPQIDLEEYAFSVDYAPVKFQSQDVEIWLPQFAVAYRHNAGRHMITEHSFSDFQLFSVQTQETIQQHSEQ